MDSARLPKISPQYVCPFHTFHPPPPPPHTHTHMRKRSPLPSSLQRYAVLSPPSPTTQRGLPLVSGVGDSVSAFAALTKEHHGFKHTHPLLERSCSLYRWRKLPAPRAIPPAFPVCWSVYLGGERRPCSGAKEVACVMTAAWPRSGDLLGDLL